MLPAIVDFLHVLGELHDDMERAIEGLPAEALDWQPASGANSIVALATHIAGAERYWIGEVFGGDPIDGPRAQVRLREFETATVDGNTLRRRLAESLAHARGVLETLTPADLDSTRFHAPRTGELHYTALWPLAHALQHTALHLGQMQLTRQLWEQRPGRA